MSRFVASYGPIDTRLRNLELWASRRPVAPGTAIVTATGEVTLTSFDSLDDVSLTDPASGDIPIFDGDYWVNSQAYVTTVPGTATRNTVQPTGDYPALLLKNNAGQSVNPFVFQTSGGTTLVALTAAGRVGVGTGSPTAWLHLPAGTAAASTAPLKLTSGTNLTTPESGALEFDGSTLAYTIGSARYILAPPAFKAAVATKTANYTLTATDDVVLANAAAAGFTVTLPTAVGIARRTYTIKKIDDTSATVCVATTGAETLDLAAAVALTAPEMGIMVVSDGANWWIIAGWQPGATSTSSGFSSLFAFWLGGGGA